MEQIIFDEHIAEKVKMRVLNGEKLGIDFIVCKTPNCILGGAIVLYGRI